MDKFTEAHKLSKLTQKVSRNLNIPISKTTELVTKKTSNKEKPPVRWLYGEFYQMFKEELTSIFLKLLQKVEEDVTLPNSFYEDNITLIPKPDKDITRKQTNTYRPPSFMNINKGKHRCKTSLP